MEDKITEQYARMIAKSKRVGGVVSLPSYIGKEVNPTKKTTRLYIIDRYLTQDTTATALYVMAAGGRMRRRSIKRSGRASSRASRKRRHN